MSWKIAPIGRGGDLLYSQAGTPSLDLRFAEKKALTDYVSGNNLVTFSRSSNATYVDSNGVIQTATTDIPRFDHNPTTGESLGLLIEESRTNSYKFSNNFTQSNYGSLLGNIPSPAYAGPGGANSATLLIPSGGSGIFTLGRSDTGTGPVIQTVSIYAKAAGYTALGFNALTGGYVNDLVVFDLSTGTVFSAQANSANAYMEPVGDGWYRCVVPSSVAYSGAAGAQLIAWYVIDQPSTGFGSYTPNGTDGIYVYGSQLEAGSFPTSYIPTSGATATRAADVAQITGSNFSSWYNQDEGTMYVEDKGKGSANGTGGKSFVVNGAATGSYSRLGVYNSTQSNFDSFTTPTNNDVIIFSTNTGGFMKHAAGLANNNTSYYKDGVLIGTDTSCGISGRNIDNARIGDNIATGAKTNGVIRRITYWPQRLPDATLQTITT